MIYLDESKHSWKLEVDSEHVLIYWEKSKMARACLLSLSELKDTMPNILQKEWTKEKVTNLKIIGFVKALELLKKTSWFKGQHIAKEIVLNTKSNLLLTSTECSLKKEKSHVLNKVVHSAPTNGSLAEKIYDDPFPVVTPRKYKVLIVDDSSTIRTLLKKVLSSSSDLEVVEAVAHPSKVKAAIEKHQPDVVTLDIHMPERNGVEVLVQDVAPKNIPAVMISSVKMEEGPLVLEALSSGAVDYIEKPALENLPAVSAEIVRRILAAAKCDIKTVSSKNTLSLPIESSSFSFSDAVIENGLVLIGSSTGGTQALQRVLTRFPTKIPPVLIVQHIPEVFSKALADRLNNLVEFEVIEATNDLVVEPNKVFIAPGGKQMALRVFGNKLTLEINNDEPVNRFRPSVDYLFNTVSHKIKKKIVAGILTGMGRDGAQGLLRLKQELNVKTFGQDEATSIVYGMPKAAYELGAVDIQCALDLVPYTIAKLFE